MRWTPHDYQLSAVNDIINNDYRQIWFLPGDGKTSCVLDAFVKLKEQGQASKLLVIAPLIAIYDTWPKEIKKWEQFEHLTFSIIHGKKRQQAIEQDADIYLINFEGLRALLGTTVSETSNRTTYDVSKFLRLNIDMLIIDELSKCKNTSTAQTKCIKLLSGYVSKRIGLTGTPAANGLMGVFGQALVVDRGETFGKSFYSFKSTYFNKGFFEYDWKLNPGAEEDIYEALSHSVTQRKESNKGDLKFNQIELRFDLPEDANTLYARVEKDFVGTFNNKKIDAVNVASKTMKLRQVASGFFYYNSLSENQASENIEALLQNEDIMNIQTRDVQHVHFKKAEILKSLAEGLNGHPLLIFYQFIPEIEMIQGVLGGKVPLLNTSSLIEDKDMIDRWNDGEIPVMIAHPKSVSYSANLQMSGGHLCFYSPEVDYELFSQAVQRIYRQGNPNHETRCYHILAENTIDPYIVHRLDEKEKAQTALINGVRAYINKTN